MDQKRTSVPQTVFSERLTETNLDVFNKNMFTKMKCSSNHFHGRYDLFVAKVYILSLKYVLSNEY